MNPKKIIVAGPAGSGKSTAFRMSDFGLWNVQDAAFVAELIRRPARIRLVDTDLLGRAPAD